MILPMFMTIFNHIIDIFLVLVSVRMPFFRVLIRGRGSLSALRICIAPCRNYRWAPGLWRILRSPALPFLSPECDAAGDP